MDPNNVKIRFDFQYGNGSKQGFGYGHADGYFWGFYFHKGGQYKYQSFYGKYYKGLEMSKYDHLADDNSDDDLDYPMDG